MCRVVSLDYMCSCSNSTQPNPNEKKQISVFSPLSLFFGLYIIIAQVLGAICSLCRENKTAVQHLSEANVEHWLDEHLKQCSGKEELQVYEIGKRIIHIIVLSCIVSVFLPV